MSRNNKNTSPPSHMPSAFEGGDNRIKFPSSEKHNFFFFFCVCAGDDTLVGLVFCLVSFRVASNLLVKGLALIGGQAQRRPVARATGA